LGKRVDEKYITGFAQQAIYLYGYPTTMLLEKQ